MRCIFSRLLRPIRINKEPKRTVNAALRPLEDETMANTTKAIGARME